MTQDAIIRNTVAIGDPEHSQNGVPNTLVINDDGSINVSGSIMASNPSVGLNNGTAPASSTEIGIIDAGGKLQGVSASNPLPITGTISASTSAHATAANPSYTEGTDDALSQDLSGHLRIVASALPLPAGAATSALQTTINTTLGSPIQMTGGTVGIVAGSAVIGHVITDSGSTTAVTGTVTVSGTVAATQSGTWNITNVSGTVSLPTGASTSALQTSVGATAHTDAVAINTTLGTPMQATGGTVGLVAGSAVIGHVITDSGSTTAVTGTVTVSGTVTVTGVATAANQTNVQAIITAATAPASMNVIGGVYHSTPLTLIDGQSSSIQFDASGFLKVNVASSGTITISGSVTANAGTNLNTSALNLETTQSGFKSANHTDLAAINTTLGSPIQTTGGTVGLVAGTAVIGHVITDSGSTTVVTGTVAISAASLPLPTGASTAAKQPALGTAGTASADVITVQGIAGATAIPVSGTVAISGTVAATQSGTWNIGTVTTVTTVSTVTAVTAITNALPAGSNLMGKVGIDQTTPGTTNATSLAQINAATTLAGNGITGTGSQRVTIASDNSALPAAGQGATGAAVPSGAVYKGLIATTANPSAATAGNLTGAMSDKVGRQTVVLNGVRDLVSDQVTSITNTSETTIVTAGGSGVFNDLLSLTFANSGATAVELTLREDTGSTVRAYYYVPAGDMRGIVFQTPFKGASNKTWTIQAGGSTSTLRVTAQFVKNI